MLLYIFQHRISWTFQKCPPFLSWTIRKMTICRKQIGACFVGHPVGSQIPDFLYVCLTWPTLTWSDLTWPTLTWPVDTWPVLTWPRSIFHATFRYFPDTLKAPARHLPDTFKTASRCLPDTIPIPFKYIPNTRHTGPFFVVEVRCWLLFLFLWQGKNKVNSYSNQLKLSWVHVHNSISGLGGLKLMRWPGVTF